MLEEAEQPIDEYLEDESSVEAESPPTADDALIDVDRLEIPLQFRIGELDLPLQRLKSLQSGYIFELQAPVSQPVTISTGGRPIGFGKLVQIGDRIGVQLTEIESWK
ncbi:MAG: FliM/FliN family flagellar motor switch protein [Planctomycetota bacterium]